MTDTRRYTLDDFDYHLPDELVAQFPLPQRQSSRLLILDANNKEAVHESFSNIPSYFNENDILIFNDAKVIPARIICRRATGAVLEIVLTRRDKHTNHWTAVSNRLKRLKEGEILHPVNDDTVAIKIVKRKEDEIIIDTIPALTDDILEKIGQLPLPPYIHRPPEETDKERYQTVYAKNPGAAAAPTAGLHFTDDILERLRQKGVSICFLTLYVSLGTFQPVRTDDISKHEMHAEEYYLPAETAEKIYEAKNKGGRVIAVGTTSLRVLESVYHNGTYKHGFGETGLYIYPPYQIKSIDGLITNFHTPKSTLLMLVASFAGYDCIMDAYRTAVKERYRFFSYGDAMLIIK